MKRRQNGRIDRATAPGIKCDDVKRLNDIRFLGSREEIIPQDCAGFSSVCKAHPPAHIEICAGGCNAVDGPKDTQDVELFFSGTLNARLRNEDIPLSWVSFEGLPTEEPLNRRIRS